MVLPLEAVEKELVACYDTCRERPTAAAAHVSKPSAVCARMDTRTRHSRFRFAFYRYFRTRLPGAGSQATSVVLSY
jgi:hypothetical protein